MRDGRVAIGWQAGAAACQPMATRPPRYFRLRKTAMDNGLATPQNKHVAC